MSKTFRIAVGAMLLMALISPAFAQMNSAEQIGNSVFDSLDRALRVNAVATGGGGGSSANFPNLDQLFNSVYDPANKAFNVNIISGLPCTLDSDGALTCAATGTSQNVTLEPSAPAGQVVLDPAGGGSGSVSLSAQVGWLVLDQEHPSANNHGSIGANSVRYNEGFFYDVIESVDSVAYSATPVFNATNGAIKEMTLTGDVTSFTITNPASGMTLRFIWIQDATGGHTVSGAPSNMYGFTPPGTTAGTESIQSCTYDGTNWVCGVANTNLTHP